MDIWKYYDGDLKYPDLIKHTEEKEIAKTNPKWAYEYLYTNVNDKSEELELIIAKDAKYSYRYAVYILNHKPFKLGEPAIAKDAFYAIRYAQNILKGPFKLGEPAIAEHAEYAYNYANDVLKGPFPLGEPAIAKDDFYTNEYTQYILEKDFYLDGKLICKYEG